MLLVEMLTTDISMIVWLCASNTLVPTETLPQGDGSG